MRYFTFKPPRSKENLFADHDDRCETPNKQNPKPGITIMRMSVFFFRADGHDMVAAIFFYCHRMRTLSNEQRMPKISGRKAHTVFSPWRTKAREQEWSMVPQKQKSKYQCQCQDKNVNVNVEVGEDIMVITITSNVGAAVGGRGCPGLVVGSIVAAHPCRPLHD